MMRRVLGTVPLPDLASAIACCLLPQPDAVSARTTATAIAHAFIIISPEGKSIAGKFLTVGESLARGHGHEADECPLSGVKRT